MTALAPHACGGVCTKARVEAEQIDITHDSDVHMSTQLER